MSNVFVTNNNDFVHQDMFDGEEYTFPPGVAVAIPFDAAVHMFGYQLADQSDTLTRLGWAAKYDPVRKIYADDPEGLHKLANFVFEEAVMVARSSLRQAPEPEIA